jgi:hypothetical protein
MVPGSPGVRSQAMLHLASRYCRAAQSEQEEAWRVFYRGLPFNMG